MPVQQGLVLMVAQDGVLFYFSFGVNSESLQKTSIIWECFKDWEMEKIIGSLDLGSSLLEEDKSQPEPTGGANRK